MQGQNIVREFIAGPVNKLQVRQIFATIQGEGPYQGRPCVFVRLTGCNLRCWFCDTQWDDERDAWMSYDDITDSVLSLRGHGGLVVITGGEPLLQPVEPLVRRLVDRALTVQFETAGSVFRNELVDGNPYGQMVQFVISPKTPKIHARWLEPRSTLHWKYPLRSENVSPFDGLPTASTQRPGVGALVCRPPGWVNRRDIYVTPLDEIGSGGWQRNVAAVVQSAMRFGYTAQTQLHKILGVE